MEIKKHTGSYNLSRRGNAAVRYISIHYTAAQTPDPPHALNNCQYFSGGDRNASADFFVDDRDIYQYNPDLRRYYTWNVGDGHGIYGIYNSNTIGIELCQIGDRPFTEAEIERAAWLVQYLMREFDVPPERVVRHWDASRKMCPYYYASRHGSWSELWKRLVGWEKPAATPVEVKRPERGRPIMAVASPTVYRVLNPKTGEHLITTNPGERDSLVGSGWKDEGARFRSAEQVSVYRLFDTDHGKHMYTASIAEANALIDSGWVYEGIGAFGVKEGGVPVYRLYNRSNGDHLFTVDENEKRVCLENGWSYEGIGWNAPK